MSSEASGGRFSGGEGDLYAAQVTRLIVLAGLFTTSPLTLLQHDGYRLQNNPSFFSFLSRASWVDERRISLVRDENDAAASFLP